jgi:hypothetical protein
MARTVKQAAEAFRAYDKRTNQKMSELRSQGSDIRKPVRSVAGASRSDQYDRAKFIYRKAAQGLSAGHPLTDKSGTPTPAAMQFKRWGAKVPKNRQDLQELKALGERLKARYKPKD